VQAMNNEKQYYNFKMHKAGISDIEQISNIRLAFLQELEGDFADADYKILLEQTRSYFTRKMEAGELYTWFVLDEKKIVTSGSLLITEMPPTVGGYGGGVEGYIFNIYTLPKYRKQGLAKNLTKEIIKEAKLKQCNRLWLMASGGHAAGIYANLGFKHRDDVMDLLFKNL
jgi:ribosomal protein S18 acetylase RimI-like enzyme